jgi:hypothetical protein
VADEVDRVLFFQQISLFTSEIAASFQQMLTGDIDFVTYAIGEPTSM